MKLKRACKYGVVSGVKVLQVESNFSQT